MELVAAIKQYMEQIQGLMQVQGSQIDEGVAGQALEDCRIIAKEARQTVGPCTRVHLHASLRSAGGLEMVFLWLGARQIEVLYDEETLHEFTEALTPVFQVRAPPRTLPCGWSSPSLSG